MTPLLDRVDNPSDLRDLTSEQLVDLAAEIRVRLIETLARTGGHLSPNLGVVELTLALHRVFDSPNDRIIWDVGHQAYVHKLITGRRDTFDSLRTFGGVSGYPSRAESPHDHVENSHASTALSYALGLAIAAEDRGEERWTVAVIGDGALTGGMAYEALSHIAVRRPRRFVILLNDNGMSYQATVGGVAATLSGVRLDRRYEWVKRTIGRVLRSMPLVGDTADELARRLKESLKQLVEPSTVFDAMGIKYAGTVDGHDLERLEETLVRAKGLDEPVVIRVQTEKGRGYPPAIADEVDRLHSVGAFDVGTGRPLKEERKLTDVAGAALLDAARRRPDVVAISAAMVSSTGLHDMETEMPERVIDTGICEQHSVTLAAGLAMGGLRPVVAIYSTFLQRALDQIISDVALHDLPVTFLVDRSGVTGPDGPSHHGVFDLTFLRMVPNMVVGAPADADELCSMIETAIDHPGPIAIRFPKAAGSALPSLPAPALPVGRWDEVRPGTDVLVLAVGRMVEPALKAAIGLEGNGISCRVVNARWVKPLDARLIDWAGDHELVLTIEDNVVSGGFGAAVLEALSTPGMAGKVRMLGIGDGFLPAGSADEVLRTAGLDVEGISTRILELTRNL